MGLLLAVIDDLYSFAMGVVLRPPAERPTPLELHAPQAVEAEEPSFKHVADIVSIGRSERTATKNTVMYAGSTLVSVYKEPKYGFDSVIETLPYGVMVMVLAQDGEWASVISNGIHGWVRRDDLIDRAAYVYPHFLVGEHNMADDPNTIKLRASIEDYFNAATTHLPLQSPEYVQYKLMRKGITIPWGQERPRVAGAWYTLLRGKEGIHISVVPKAGMVMEYMISEDTGHLAYVEAVFPNETITISEVDYPNDGVYNERVLTRDEWLELRPVFIQIITA
jgi:hypothetical protein